MSKTALEITKDDRIDNSQRAEILEDLVFQLGGLDAISTIVNNLNAALITRLQAIRDTHAYRSTGFNRFDDFMDNHPRSPMSYKRFNHIENIFRTLGPDIFDLTAHAGLSIRQQKLLGKSKSIRIDGEKIIVETEKGQTLEIDEPQNARQWRQTLTILADANTEKSKKLEKGQEDYRRLKEKFLNAETESEGNQKLSKLEKVHTAAIGGLAALAAELEKATEADCLQYADASVTLLASQFNRINAVLSEKIGVDSIAELGAEGDDERLAGLLDD